MKRLLFLLCLLPALCFAQVSTSGWSMYPGSISGGGSSDTTLNAKLKFSAFLSGKKVAWMGDSITNGSASTNASSLSFRAMAPKIIGSMRIGRSQNINAGVPGDSAEDLLARTDAIIAQNPELAFMMIGTNGSPTLSGYINSVNAIISKMRLAKIPLVIGLVPPRGSGQTTEVIERTRTYNLWLEMSLNRQGISVADTYTALVDPTTGLMSSTYDSGDGIHPNDAGHLALAQAIVPAIMNVLPPIPPPVNNERASWGPGLITNSLQAVTTGWTAANTPTPPAVRTISVVDPEADDILPSGKWFKINLDNTGGAGTTTATYYQALGTLPAAGDVLLVSYAVKKSGSSAAGTNVKVTMANSATDFAVLTDVFGVNKPGLYFDTCTVPASPTSIRLRLTVTTAAGANNAAYIGSVQVWNLTALGLVDQY